MKIRNIILFLSIKMAVAVILVAVALVYLIGVINKESQSILDKKVQSLLRQRQQEIQLSLLSDFKKVEPHLEKVNKALPSVEDIAINLSLILDDLASKNSIRLSFNIDPPQIFTLPSSKKASTINYTLNLTGAINNFSNFLKDLENLPYFMVINRFDISGSDLNSDTNINITGVFYAK